MLIHLCYDAYVSCKFYIRFFLKSTSGGGMIISTYTICGIGAIRGSTLLTLKLRGLHEV